MAGLRKMLGRADDDYIIALMRLIETQSKETIVTWCLNYAKMNILPIYNKHIPDDDRPLKAINAANDYLKGSVKFTEVKDIILNQCHQAARELDDNPAAQAAARTIGQAASSIHTVTHALGLAFYGSAAIAYDRVGLNESQAVYAKIAREECEKMYASLKAVSVENEVNPVKVKWYC